jgi:nucleotide-binding universal stress UspA family protein
LLPVDLSDRHAAALDLAVKLRSARHGEIALLHVIEVIAGLSQEEEKNFYHRLEKTARRHLEELLRNLKKRKARCRMEIVVGRRVQEIVCYAEANGTDLIILTAPYFDANNPVAGWGSLSHKVSVAAACPVLLVKASRRGAEECA